MSSAFEHATILYTIRSEDRGGLLDAVDELKPDHYEVVVYPNGDLSTVTLLTQDRAGLVTALSDVAPEEWDQAIVRVYDAPARTSGGAA